MARDVRCAERCFVVFLYDGDNFLTWGLGYWRTIVGYLGYRRTIVGYLGYFIHVHVVAREVSGVINILTRNAGEILAPRLIPHIRATPLYNPPTSPAYLFTLDIKPPTLLRVVVATEEGVYMYH